MRNMLINIDPAHTITSRSPSPIPIPVAKESPTFSDFVVEVVTQLEHISF
jgi:hypothetical protein